jgi:hypothetical protein
VIEKPFPYFFVRSVDKSSIICLPYTARFLPACNSSTISRPIIQYATIMLLLTEDTIFARACSRIETTRSNKDFLLFITFVIIYDISPI